MSQGSASEKKWVNVTGGRKRGRKGERGVGENEMSLWFSPTYVKLNIKLVFEHVNDDPAFAKPSEDKYVEQRQLI